jgi:hypothetical protein
MKILSTERDYAAFEETIEEILRLYPMRILAYWLMPNRALRRAKCIARQFDGDGGRVALGQFLSASSPCPLAAVPAGEFHHVKNRFRGTAAQAQSPNSGRLRLSETARPGRRVLAPASGIRPRDLPGQLLHREGQRVGPGIQVDDPQLSRPTRQALHEFPIGAQTHRCARRNRSCPGAEPLLLRTHQTALGRIVRQTLHQEVVVALQKRSFPERRPKPRAIAWARRDSQRSARRIRRPAGIRPGTEERAFLRYVPCCATARSEP